MPSFAGIDPWISPAGPVPAYPLPSNAHDTGAPQRQRAMGSGPETDELREEIRRMVIEELRQIIKG